MRLLLISLFSIVLFFALLSVSYAAPRNDCHITVGSDQRYKTINSGISAASAGQIVCVKKGIYHEVININKPGLTLTAHNPGPDERPIIDGNTNPDNGEHNFELPNYGTQHKLDVGNRYYNYSELVTISQDNVTFSHFIVRNSRGDHIQLLSKKGVKVHHILAQNAMVTNINIVGDGSPGDGDLSNQGTVISDNTFEHSSLYPLYCISSPSKFCNWPGAACLKGVEGVLVKNNIIRYSRGDGILLDCNWGKSNNNEVVGNIVYDNKVTLIYLHASSKNVVRNNLVFSTPTNPYNGPQPNWFGVNIQAQETETFKRMRNKAYGVTDSQIYNNIYWGLRNGIRLQTQAPWGVCKTPEECSTYPKSYIKNVDIFNNTFVSTGDYYYEPSTEPYTDVRITTKFYQAPGFAENVKIRNNIFYHAKETGQTPVLIHGKADGISFSNNIWSKKPDNVDVSKDFTADPKLMGKTGTGDFPLFQSPPSYDDLMRAVKWFELKNSSPAIDKALSVNYINNDYYYGDRPFGPMPDIGAHEYGSTSTTPSPSQPVTSWDLNSDNTINHFDFTLLINQYFSDFSFTSLTEFLSAL